MIRAVVFDMYETLITLFDCPVYDCEQMAKDAGILYERFTDLWRLTEDGRTTGKLTVENVILHILQDNNCFTEEKYEMIVKKLFRYKKEVFEYMHPEILPMLVALKEQGLKIGLISNCHSEEAMVIKESVLFPYFDAVCLSYDEGIKKPDRRIFERCLELLKLNPSECLYVGDGGSNELEVAEEIGMHPAQAVWYLKPGTKQPTGRMPEFINIERPMDVINIIGTTNVISKERRDLYGKAK